MRSRVLKISAAVLGLCLLALGFLYAPRAGEVVVAQFPGAALMPDPVAPTNPDSALPIDQRQTMELSPTFAMRDELTKRELRDQYRDWLLLAALTAHVPSAEEFNRITFDLPVVRHGYMRPLANFEYGETRSRFIGGGTVLTLIPANVAANVRKDYLAHVADEHRKNLGGSFERLLILEYELDADKGTAALTRRADVAYTALFSSEYGYFEQRVANATDLEGFMTSVDDLTVVTKTDGGLLLGGRKILGYRYRPITPEMVATVWQAERRIQSALDDFEAYEQRLINEFNARWSSRIRTSMDERLYGAEMNAEKEKLQKELQENYRGRKLVNGSGFSLDPTYDFVDFEKHVSDLNAALRELGPEGLAVATAIARNGIDLNDALRRLVGADAVVAAIKGLQNRDIVPLLRVQAKLKELPPGDFAVELLEKILGALEQRHQFQAARYDGDLKGTEVGMVLFYTDLLAKLWVLDFVQGAPNKCNLPTGCIEDFIDIPRVKVSPIYEPDNQVLSAGRLWFGKQDIGFQLASGRNSIFLARNATRVYSLGNNPLNPRAESQTSVELGTPIYWWNDHYEEIARYEQEYERLNQIMKWSIVIGWLNEGRAGDKLGFLAGTKIDRSKWLPDWVRQPEQLVKNLRFSRWGDIQFMAAGYKGTSTEALPLLLSEVFVRNGRSKHFGGGVSLAPKAAFHGRAPIAASLPRTVLRSDIDYAVSSGARTITTFDKAVYTFKSGETNFVSLLARAEPKIKMRATTAELVNGDVERMVTRSAHTVRMETRAANVRVGELEVGRTAGGFRVGWQARELDAAHATARQMSAAPDPIRVLAGDPNVRAIVRLPDEVDFLVQMRGSAQWMRFKQMPPSRDLAQGWQLRAADFKDAKREIAVQAVDRQQLNALAGQQGHIVLGDGALQADGKFVVQVARGQPARGTATVDVDAGGITVKTWIDAQNAVHISTPVTELPVDLTAFVRRFGPADIANIRAAAARPGGSTVPRRVALADDSVAQARLAGAEARSSRQAASDIISNPAAARRALDRQIAGEIETNAAILRDRGVREAIEHFDALIELYGKLPELTLRRSLLHIEAGRMQEAVVGLVRAPRPMRGPDAFYREINGRLANPTISPATRGNLYREAEFADLQDSLLTRRRALGDLLLPRAEGGRFEFDLRLGTVPERGRPATIDGRKLATGDVVIYRQDSTRLNELFRTADAPGLNNVDWSVAVETSLRQMISGGVGRITRLPRGDIAHFRPAAIHVPDATGTKTVTLQKMNPNVGRVRPTNSYSACDPTSESCKDTPSDQSAEVYLLEAN